MVEDIVDDIRLQPIPSLNDLQFFMKFLHVNVETTAPMIFLSFSDLQHPEIFHSRRMLVHPVA